MARSFLSMNEYNVSLQKLIVSLDKYGNDDLKKKARELFRKSFIVSSLLNKYIVAITGLQGVGKSTIIKSLYDLEEDALIRNPGLGETIPILITESGSPKRCFYVHHFDKDKNGLWSYETRKTEISPTEFKSRSHSYKPGDLFLELVLPHKVFESESHHLLLLPGFENQDDYLKDLTYCALNAASTCIVVFYEQKYATSSNEKLISYISDKFTDAKPIFLLSWADVSGDKNAGFAKRVISDFNLGETEIDRVIPVGKHYTDWHDKLVNSIRSYARSSNIFIKNQLDNIQDILDQGTSLNLSTRVFLDTEADEYNLKEYQSIDAIVDIIDAEIKNLKSEFEDQLNAIFTDYFSKARESLKEKIEQENYFLEWLSGLLKNPIKKEKELEKLIRESMADKNQLTIEESVIIAINRVVNINCEKYNIGKLPETTDSNIGQEIMLAGGKQQSRQNQMFLDSEITSDLKIVFHNTNDEFSKTFEKTVKLIPIITFEAMRLGMIFPELFDGSKEIEGKLTTSLSSRSLSDLYMKNRREIALGIGILFGMDVIPDGEFDLFGLLRANAVASTAGNTASSAGAEASAATAHWVLASIVAAAAIAYCISEAQKDIVERHNKGIVAYNDMKAHIINHYLCNFDKTMIQLKSIIIERLRQLHDLPQKFTDIHNLYRVVDENTKLIRKIKEEIRINDPTVDLKL